MFSERQLAQALGCPVERAVRWHAPLVGAMQRYGISTPLRAAHFLAQVGHESAGLYRLEENLNYSAKRLLEVFPKYFNAAAASQCAGRPEAIANRVYGGRNGNCAPGHGYLYRGRGPIQITGQSNYAQMQQDTGLPLLASPDLALTPEGGSTVACAWWRRNGLLPWSDRDDCLAVSRIVNLGSAQRQVTPNGYADRRDRLKRAKNALAIS